MLGGHGTNSPAEYSWGVSRKVRLGGLWNQSKKKYWMQKRSHYFFWHGDTNHGRKDIDGQGILLKTPKMWTEYRDCIWLYSKTRLNMTENMLIWARIYLRGQKITISLSSPEDHIHSGWVGSSLLKVQDKTTAWPGVRAACLPSHRSLSQLMQTFSAHHITMHGYKWYYLKLAVI